MTTEMSPTSMKFGNLWSQRSNSFTTLNGGQMSGGEISSGRVSIRAASQFNPGVCILFKRKFSGILVFKFLSDLFCAIQ